MLKFFIKNPIFSSVIAIIIVICGITAILNLPLEEYPNITPPTITITAKYPGANAKILERTIASPIEDQMNGSSQMIYMNSVMSSNGTYNLIITFETGTDLNNVVGDVLNRLNSALPLLPQITQNLGVTMRKSSQNLLMSLAIQSDGRYDDVYLSNYVYRSIYTELTRIKGVGSIDMIGDRSYSMRVWLKPDIMTKLSIGVDDITSAIKDQNIQVAVGKTGYPPTDGTDALSLNLNGTGYYTDPEQFANIVIRNESTGYIRLKDIARIELGAQSYDTNSLLNNEKSVGLQIYLDSDANQLKTYDLVTSTMEKLKQQFPQGITYKVAFDNTKFVTKALTNVFDTLRDACILVILVVFIFLQKGKATLIPIITIPVAVIGTFAGMYATGFSINNLTLFGLILSIGIVVDDSIVVIENVERIMHNDKLSAFEASVKTMDEVASALVAIVLVLCCAFIPSSFLGGLTGILYRQFAITITIAVVISGIIALTLTPALCAIMLKNKNDFETKNKFFVKFNLWFDNITEIYIKAIKYVINHKTLSSIICIIIFILTIIIYEFIPIGFIPNEDKGFLTTQISLPENASLNQTESVAKMYVKNLLKNSEIENNIELIGIDNLNGGSYKTNVATIISSLTDWDKRNDDVNTIINQANQYGSSQKNANFVAYNQPAIDGLSGTNGVEFYIADKVSGDYTRLQQILNKITTELSTNLAIKNAYFSFNANDTEVNITPRVEQAKMYGVNVADIYNVLATNYAPNLVNYFYKMGGLYWVTIEGDLSYRTTPFQLNNLTVKSTNGQMVPITSITSTKITTAPDVIERFNGYLAARVVVEPNEGYTIQDTMNLINKSVSNILPKEYTYFWYGVSYQQQQTTTSSLIAFAFGVVMIFLVLAAQFEMWRLPFVIILAIPFALCAAGIMLFSKSLDNDLYFQISLITLLGLSAKNSILIAEFALEHTRQGLNPVSAIILASKQRFRPIIMTSLAFILGALPLVYASGANSNAQHSVGTGIVGGMLGSTFIATIFIPLFFVMIIKNKEKSNHE